jgi:hypothetical protein
MCAAEGEHCKAAIRVDALNHESDFIKVSGHDNAWFVWNDIARCCKEISTGIDCPLDSGCIQGVC